MTLVVEVAFGLMAALGAAMATGLWRRRPGAEERFAAKLSQIDDHAMSLQEIELSTPFTERFLVPMRDRLVQAITSRTPASRQEALKRLIIAAGHPYNATVSAILTAKVALAVALAGVVAFVFLPFVHVQFPLNLIGLAAGLLGWILPDRWLQQKAGKRRRQIENVIPDTIDLLTICVDAGLSFDAALMRITDKVEGPLRDEMQVMLADIRYGRPRSEAMEALAARIDVEDMTAFTSAIVQSQKLGVAIGETVRIQSAEIRRRRRQKAEEKAGQASLKMLFPMIGCIFPTLFIVLMGPVALILINRH